MCVLSSCLVMIFLSPVNGTSHDEYVKKMLNSKNYAVTWETVPVYPPAADLEIGNGNGHSGTLDWIRFHPDKNGVDVLSIQFHTGWNPYKSKWPPDRVPVSIKYARLKSHAYAALLHDLAIVGSAKLKPFERNWVTGSSIDLWVYARLTSNKKTFLELNWAGYESSVAELEYAKPLAAVNLAQEAVKGLDFKDHKLTDLERAWASEKFARLAEVQRGRVPLVGARTVH